MHYQDGELMCISSRRTRSRRDYLRVGKIEVSLEWKRVVAVIMLEESFTIPIYSQIQKPVL
jgi:hypothetical protein